MLVLLLPLQLSRWLLLALVRSESQHVHTLGMCLGLLPLLPLMLLRRRGKRGSCGSWLISVIPFLAAMP